MLENKARMHNVYVHIWIFRSTCHLLEVMVILNNCINISKGVIGFFCQIIHEKDFFFRESFLLGDFTNKSSGFETLCCFPKPSVSITW